MSDKLTVEEWGSHIFQAKAVNMRPLAEALFRLQETINNPNKHSGVTMEGQHFSEAEHLEYTKAFTADGKHPQICEVCGERIIWHKPHEHPPKQTSHFIIEGGTNDSDSGKTKWDIPPKTSY